MLLGSHLIRHVVEWYLFWHLVDHHHVVLGALLFLIVIAVAVIGAFVFVVRKVL
jgi:hypothetical protein